MRLSSATRAVALSCSLVAALSLGVHAGLTARSAQSTQQSCVRYIIIDTRGSGEPQGTLSPPGKHFVAEWRRLHPGATVVVVKNPYAAPGWLSFPGAVIKVPGSYHRSVVAGKNWLENELVGFAHCGHSTSILLTGYSQGAQVAADVVQAISPSLVLGVALFGDPYFDSHDRVDRGGFQVGRNGFLGKRRLFSAYWRPHVLSYCHLHDPVCQGALHNASYLFSRHNNYGKLGEPEQAARYFAHLEDFSKGNLLVSGDNANLYVFTPSGKPLPTLYDHAGDAAAPFGAAFDKHGNFYVANPDAHTVSKFDRTGSLIGVFASHFSALPESLTFAPNGDLLVGQGLESGPSCTNLCGIEEFNSHGSVVTTFSPAVDWIGGVESMTIAKDGCTLYYTNGTPAVRRYDICTRQQLPDFADNLPGGAEQIRLLPSGEMVVADSQSILRLNSNGTIVQQYSDPTKCCWKGVDLTPDGSGIWGDGALPSGFPQVLEEWSFASGREITSFKVMSNGIITIVGSPAG